MTDPAGTQKGAAPPEVAAHAVPSPRTPSISAQSKLKTGGRIRLIVFWSALVSFLAVLPLAFIGVASLLDRTPGWLESATALGTIGAALFAGVAALVAAWSAKASRDLVVIESTRDQALQHEQRVRQAMSTFFDIRAEPTEPPANLKHRGLQLRVTNAGTEPIRSCCVRISRGTTTWGPLDCGTLAPHDSLDVVFSMSYFGDGSDVTYLDLESSVSFTDIRGRTWLLKRDVEPLELRPGEVHSLQDAARNWDLRAISELEWWAVGCAGPLSQGDALDAFQKARARK